jgi:hypothetical protein
LSQQDSYDAYKDSSRDARNNNDAIYSRTPATIGMPAIAGTPETRGT